MIERNEALTFFFYDYFFRESNPQLEELIHQQIKDTNWKKKKSKELKNKSTALNEIYNEDNVEKIINFVDEFEKEERFGILFEFETNPHLVISYLKNKKEHILWKNQHGQNFLHIYFLWNENISVKLVNFLIKNGVDLNLKEIRQGRTPFHFLCRYNNNISSDLLKDLIEKRKVGLEVEDNSGKTPLYYLFKNNKSQLNFSKYLVEEMKIDISKYLVKENPKEIKFEEKRESCTKEINNSPEKKIDQLQEEIKKIKIKQDSILEYLKISTCGSCKKLLDTNFKFCPHCGSKKK
jgi:hypothetical protein